MPLAPDDYDFVMYSACVTGLVVNAFGEYGKESGSLQVRFTDHRGRERVADVGPVGVHRPGPSEDGAPGTPKPPKDGER